jgi:hypothetical protein
MNPFDEIIGMLALLVIFSAAQLAVLWVKK